tara:strand:- start:120 stop:665 length:546 start_codon:yes stop_codon:yes gene_type:complete
MKLTKHKLEQLILQEMRHFRPPEFDPRAEKNYPDYTDKLSNLYKQDPSQAASLGDSLDEPIDVPIPDTDQEPEKLPFPTDELTHGRLSGLRLHPGGGSSQSVIYKMHNTGREFLNFLDQTVGIYDIHGSFYNEEYIKSFGLSYGKEKEQLLRAYIEHTELDLGHHDDNFYVEEEMIFGPEE